MAETMGNDKAIKPLIDYLAAIEIGGREGANRRSKEWGGADWMESGKMSRTLSSPHHFKAGNRRTKSFQIPEAVFEGEKELK